MPGHARDRSSPPDPEAARAVAGGTDGGTSRGAGGGRRASEPARPPSIPHRLRRAARRRGPRRDRGRRGRGREPRKRRAAEHLHRRTARIALDDELAARIPFDGPHQAGILTPRAGTGDVRRARLDRAQTGRAREALQSAQHPGPRTDRRATPIALLEESTTRRPDSGILGPVNAPDALTVTIAFGASLFDERYGLAEAAPKRVDPDADVRGR